MKAFKDFTDNTKQALINSLHRIVTMPTLANHHLIMDALVSVANIAAKEPIWHDMRTIPKDYTSVFVSDSTQIWEVYCDEDGGIHLKDDYKNPPRTPIAFLKWAKKPDVMRGCGLSND